MADRLSALDASFLHIEQPTTPMHVGGLAVFSRPRGFDYADMAAHVAARIGLVPRYRQRVVAVPGNIANPVWVDDADFDLSYHLRRSAVPRPGRDDQLLELVARLMSRPLDRDRPLWEMYVVEGLSGRRLAIISKTHHAMVDGLAAVDLGQVILDATPNPPVPATVEPWLPAPVPSPLDLVVDAIGDIARRPSAAVDALRGAMIDVQATAERMIGVAGGFASAVLIASRPAPDGPLNVEIGRSRRFAVARTTLEDHRIVRKRHDGTVNDVVLATVTGALRSFLMSRGEDVRDATTLRALVPVSVRDPREKAPDTVAAGDDGTARSPASGNRILCYFVDLPVGEPDPLVRLTRVSHAMRAVKQAGQSVGADALIRMAGFSPPTVHALGARAVNTWSRKLFNVIVTNVPGPQIPLYAAGAQMREVFPVVPLAKGQALAIGLTSYDGGVYYGLNADGAALGDVDVLGGMLSESLAELVATVGPTFPDVAGGADR